MAFEHRFAELASHVAREINLLQASDVCCGDLTLEQFQTLRAVNDADQLSIGVLSSRLRVDLSTMSRNVTLLERNGYLLRARAAEDARIVHVRLTSKGKRALNTLCCEERDVLKIVYQRLSPSDRPKVLKALELLRACLDDSGIKGAVCCPPPTIRKSAS